VRTQTREGAAKIADIEQVRADLLALMESDEYRTLSREVIIPDEHGAGR
jgi:hypothetical protein